MDFKALDEAENFLIVSKEALLGNERAEIGVQKMLTASGQAGYAVQHVDMASSQLESPSQCRGQLYLEQQVICSK